MREATPAEVVDEPGAKAPPARCGLARGRRGLRRLIIRGDGADALGVESRVDEGSDNPVHLRLLRKQPGHTACHRAVSFVQCVAPP